MEPLNVDIPANLLTAIQTARGLTGKPIRAIAVEAFTLWLKANGLSVEKIERLRPKQ